MQACSLTLLCSAVVIVFASAFRLDFLDLSFVGWQLLFLSKCLDLVTSPTLTLESTHSQRKSTPTSKGELGIQNRWEFLQGESSLQASKGSSKSSSSKMYRRRMQKRLMHTKQHLYELQVNAVPSSASPPLNSPDQRCCWFLQKTKNVIETQEKSMMDKVKAMMLSADSAIHQLEAQEAMKQQLKANKDILLKQYSTKVPPHAAKSLNCRWLDLRASCFRCSISRTC